MSSSDASSLLSVVYMARNVLYTNLIASYKTVCLYKTRGISDIPRIVSDMP